MTSVAIVGNSDKETIIQAIKILKQIPGFRIIFVKQSEEKLYVVTDSVFNVKREGMQQ